MSDWGFTGDGDRVWELPDIDAPQDKDRSGPERARQRFNTPAGQVEWSIKGGPWMPQTAGGANAALSQIDFYIDPVNGDDANSGASASEALATWAEYSSRVGLGIVTASPWQTVNLLNDLPASDPIKVHARYENGLVIQGQRSPILSGTVTTAIGWDLTTSPVTAGTLEDASLPATSWSDSGPGGTSLIGKMIVMTSGTNVGKIGWLLSDLGGKVARISQLIDIFAFTTGTPSPGDTYDVVDLTVVAGGIEQIGDSGEFVNLDSCDVTASEPLQASGGEVVPSNCRFEQTGSFTLVIANALFQPGACLFHNPLDITACASAVYFGCSFIDARLRVNYTDALFFLINAAQKDPSGSFASSDTFIALDGGSITVVSSTDGLGVMDQAVASADAFAITAQSKMEVGLTATAFTIGQTAGGGIRISSMGLATWQSSEMAAVYDFDVSGPAVEWTVGGVVTTSGALGAGGTISASNGAAAIPLVS